MSGNTETFVRPEIAQRHEISSAFKKLLDQYEQLEGQSGERIRSKLSQYIDILRDMDYQQNAIEFILEDIQEIIDEVENKVDNGDLISALSKVQTILGQHSNNSD